MEEESTVQNNKKNETVEENVNQSKRARISYDLTKSFNYAEIAGSYLEKEKIAEVSEDLDVDGDVHIVNQM